jgi:hypothetical protein
MYYLLVYLACSEWLAKKTYPDGQLALLVPDAVLRAGFQSLIFNPENGFGFRTIAP